jgi:hypothetical protein
MKRLLLFGIVCIACTHSSHAQFSIRSLNSSNQQLIEEAVKEGFFIVHRSYQLKDTTDTPQYYGWNNAPNFGETYSLGVKAINGYYLDDKAIHPWLYDSKFDEYRDNRQYVPVVSKSEYKSYKILTDSSFITFPIKDSTWVDNAEKSFYFVTDSVFENDGFSLDDSDGVKQGWLVWLVSVDSLEKKNNESLSLMVYRSELEFVSGKNTYKIDTPSTNKLIWGGIYIVPKIDGVGRISLSLSGFASKKDGDWQVIRLGDKVEEDAVQPLKPVKEGGLTPVKEKTDNKERQKTKK